MRTQPLGLRSCYWSLRILLFCGCWLQAEPEMSSMYPMEDQPTSRISCRTLCHPKLRRTWCRTVGDGSPAAPRFAALRTSCKTHPSAQASPRIAGKKNARFPSLVPRSSRPRLPSTADFVLRIALNNVFAEEVLRRPIRVVSEQLGVHSDLTRCNHGELLAGHET